MSQVHVNEPPWVREKRIQQVWKDERIFEQSISNREGKEIFVLYEGPPTANGLPHAGHVLGRVIKDFVARYQTMNGYQVKRKAGWDTHGLPVELGVEKQLGISGKQEIEEYGVEKFIGKCKESVFSYEKEWRKFTEMIGYWVDMNEPYITLDNHYIESVWYILSTIHQKGLLYKGHRVSPYCPSCQTSLSSHEVAQGYKDVKDLSVTAKFKIEGTENQYILGWTTTPWTLPANVALAVHRELIYVKVLQNDEIYVVAEERLRNVLKGDYTVLSTHKGEDFVGVSYASPFSYVKVKNGHQVVHADFVTNSSGTGIVHLAPAYGEDDYQAVLDNHFDFVNVVDGSGCYTEEVIELAGRFVKDCDVDIIKMLAAKGLLFDKEKYGHSYPHCWRCDSPLLYYAMEGWFIQTTAMKEMMKQNNDAVTWHPAHIKDGRFGNFLDHMVDWNLGRNRYWGTPLNIWECQSCHHQYAPLSLADMRKYATHEISADIELHKPYVDQVRLRCSCCGEEMVRTKEVIDVWFDSGSMPFAQYHYPFENKELFEKQFPADVIAEGVDQTRGWFYSLLAVSTLFTGKVPYKRVLSLGHILDEAGRKMSKSKGNVMNPVELIEEFGADALRWALLADSAPWSNKKFSKQVVSQAKSKLVDTFVNIHSFYSLYASIDQFASEKSQKGTNTLLDQWVLSRLNTVIKDVKKLLEKYEITSAARELLSFVDEVSNWYIRRSRERFWSEGISEDKLAAFHTLYEVQVKLCQLLAPFTPFVADDIYRNLTGSSVHLSNFPEVNVHQIDEVLEQQMGGVLQVVELARSVRNATGIKTKQPLSKLVIMSTDEGGELEFLKDFTRIIEEEVNVKEVITTIPSETLRYSLKLHFGTAGPKLGNHTTYVHLYLEGLDSESAKAALKDGGISVQLPNGEAVKIDLSDVVIEKYADGNRELASNRLFTVLLDTTINEELKREGFARELIRAVQNYRKELSLPVEKRVNITIDATGSVQDTIQEYESLLRNHLLVNRFLFGKDEHMKYVQINEQHVGIFIHE
ncbi:isoleucine--tRNA ligase [Cytobacillus spongiae]|uniref:isoleucine--tRNA ligase n=1 Tax=Cytobacillus spongiae TaxID=2901381 RepID=UPI001F0075D5|nr:isoleucine--tRNA ligase [Cytobacillus spongiae]UII55531.1 isoleucine--tRNA ligase [Cytobacillus spongiae]